MSTAAAGLSPSSSMGMTVSQLPEQHSFIESLGVGELLHQQNMSRFATIVHTGTPHLYGALEFNILEFYRDLKFISRCIRLA